MNTPLSVEDVDALAAKASLSPEDLSALFATIRFLFKEKDRLDSIVCAGVKNELAAFKAMIIAQVAVICPQVLTQLDIQKKS